MEAIFTVAGQLHANHGLVLDNLGVENLSEWSDDSEEQPDSCSGPYSADTAAHALLLAIDRLLRLGHSPADGRTFADLVLGGLRAV
ncbi:hypothetical protein [Kitasatospora aureofaciens]|uniref:hypothetical protein n=1 Tax=Kitasatospora aureofaciens TaxID=1894 RepID=UPI0036F47174